MERVTLTLTRDEAEALRGAIADSLIDLGEYLRPTSTVFPEDRTEVDDLYRDLSNVGYRLGKALGGEETV